MTNLSLPSEHSKYNSLKERPIAQWEEEAIAAVGRIMDYWGFKRNYGRLWGLLYLRNKPMDASALIRLLGLSKGAVSMILRDLELWTVIRRVSAQNRSGIAYVAQRDLWHMIETVLERREKVLFSEVRDNLKQVEVDVMDDENLDKEERKAIRQSVQNMRKLADVSNASLNTFMKSRQLDLSPFLNILIGRK